MFKKILVANRGEIAVRVMRACREMEIASVAVYSAADRAALHVLRADEACFIGPANASESYLNSGRILEAARVCGADAIHPGYGFLSENADFAEACADAGIKFIGPGAPAMRRMGFKTSARQAMAKIGVPHVPGSSANLTLDAARSEAARVGYPVMLKAAAGGGGKGMRRVDCEADLESAYRVARSEAARAFNNDEVYLEKLIVNPRHIEIQLLADDHGHVVYLGERECSLQRRHQKVMEESPSTFIDEPLRKRMGEMAVAAARATGYVNAGTIEFLVDASRNPYFLEMNTRLQVEHPVTELVTGLDLVQLQIRVAAGEALPFNQEDVELRGHAMECRIYAEDPRNNYYPSPGVITSLQNPGGPGIREDSGIYEGWRVPVEYDPLLSKLIAYGENREVAMARLRRALDEYYVGGIKTNLALFGQILRNEEFIAGRMHTGLLDEIIAGDKKASSGEQGIQEKLAAVAAAILYHRQGGNPDANGARVAAMSGCSPSAPPEMQSELSRWKAAARQEGLR